MRRRCLFVRISLLVLLLASVGPPRANAREEKPDEVIELNVTAAAAPHSLFKHRFTVLPHETLRGNAAMTYMRSFGENNLQSRLKAMELKFGPESRLWYSGDSPPPEKVIQASKQFDTYVDEFIAFASRQRKCEWGFALEDLTGLDVIGFNLGVLQDTRSISRVLGLRTRAAIYEGEFDKAVAHMRMNYQLGRNVSRVPSLVAGLIGLAEIGIANQGVEELIGTENSPNLYWALTELPSPIIDLRPHFRVEMHWAHRIVPELAEADKEHSEEQWNEMLKSVSARIADGSIFMLTRGKPSAAGAVAPAFFPVGIGMLTYSAAKKRLVAAGVDKEKVEVMCVSEVLIKDAARETRRLSELSERVIYFPFFESMELSIEAEEEIARSERSNSPGAILSGMLLPASLQVRNSLVRVDRDICALRVIEAIRMHAAQSGELPENLDEVSVVPIPRNPATGKVFSYRVEGGAAILDMDRGAGGLQSKRYIIRMR